MIRVEKVEKVRTSRGMILTSVECAEVGILHVYFWVGIAGEVIPPPDQAREGSQQLQVVSTHLAHHFCSFVLFSLPFAYLACDYASDMSDYAVVTGGSLKFKGDDGK
jgi:hypothetical protein